MLIVRCFQSKTTYFLAKKLPSLVFFFNFVDTTYQGSDRQDLYRHGKKKKRDASVRHTLVACGTCYRKSEGTELCGIELPHSSL